MELTESGLYSVVEGSGMVKKRIFHFLGNFLFKNRMQSITANIFLP
jgi:hypothetical protein